MADKKLKVYPPIPHKLLSHRITTAILMLFFKASMRFKVQNMDNVPRSGPLIMVSNHLNNLDSIILLTVFPRWINFIGKESLFKHPVLRAIMYWGRVIPIQRNGAVTGKRDAIRRARQVLQKEYVLGIFPEGMRSKAHALIQPQPGAMYIAAEQSTILIPVGISGTEKCHGIRWVLKRPPVTINVGNPFTLPLSPGAVSRDGLDAAGEFTMKQIAALLPPEYRGVFREATGETVRPH